MKQRYLAGTDLHLSAIGYGCYGLSGAYGPKEPAQVTTAIRRAHELGVTFFDTAEAYGQGEVVLGEAVRGFRHRVVIATKVGPTTGGDTRLTEARLLSACTASLRALQSDYIDLYQVHYDDPTTPVEETIAGLKRLQAEGKIRYFGVGHLPSHRVREYLRGGAITLLCELSPVERQLYRETYPAVAEHGAGVIGFSVTGRGLLTGKLKAGHQFTDGDIRRIDPLFQGEALQSALRVADLLGGVGAVYGRSPAQTAIAWVLAQPRVLSALTGPSSIVHLEENLGGGDDWLPAQDIALIDETLAREEARLRQLQMEMVRRTLREPLPEGVDDAWRRLVAAMESMIKYGLVAEAQIVPIFTALYRGRKTGLDARRINAAQAQLRELWSE